MSEPHSDPSLEPQEPTGLRRTGVLQRIRAYFLAGVLITSPIVITLVLALWLINFVDSHIVPLIPEQWNPDTYLRELFGFKFSIPGIGVVIVFVVMTLIGWVTASYLGRSFVRIGENIVARMPIVRGIYGAVKQIMETIFRNQSQAFRRAVLVEYPRRGLWTVAFVTGKAEGGGTDLTNPAFFWPEGYVYVAFCLNIRALVLEQEFDERQTVVPALGELRTWWSFRENVERDPGLAVAFLDLFAGEEPHWTAPDVFTPRRGRAIAARFYREIEGDPPALR